MPARTAVLVRLLAALAALLAISPATAAAQTAAPDGRDDAVVIAVIDNAFSPYHWDFLAPKMPQAKDGDPTNDLPLDQPPDTWLRGFPSPSAFTTYDRIDLTLDQTNPNRSMSSLESSNSAKWNKVKTSTATEAHYYWLPRTKVIGALTFSTTGKIRGTAGSHGTGTTSVSVGNLFGTCPECLLVIIQYGSVATGEAAINWAMSQPWIDAISNSYGFSLVERDRLYSGSDEAAQRAASERGQTILFSAGNGMTNTFTIPNGTLFSSQEGPDWMVTVGAVTPSSGASYTGHGKPADISGVGSQYPSAYTATTVSGKGNTGFGGTSNATPTVAGTYGRALYLARGDLAGPSRVQEGGVIATGDPYACGEARPDCELGDGVLTAAELRTRLFHGAVHTPAGMNIGGLSPDTPPIGEDEFLNEGHGTYFARLRGDEAWLAEFDRVIGPLEGRAAALTRPAGEREWMVVDSFCRQEIWGDWSGGYFVRGTTALPGPSPSFPLRSALEAVCPALFPPV